MKTYISMAMIVTLSLTHTASLMAASETLDTEISRINASITGSLDSAPVPIDSNPLLYSPWELLHRGPMIDGFQWTGEIAQYITPHMYDGTPFAKSISNIWGSTTTLSEFLVEEATTYQECLTNELYLSFWLGERLESSDIRELKAIAKSCAQQFYGTYFDGKSYTTREEYLMMLLTVFGEDVAFAWEFTDDGRYVSTGTGVESGFANVSAKAWYSPYLAYADEIGILSTDELKWDVAKMISDTEAIDMLSLYTEYRMGYTGSESLKNGIIQSNGHTYTLKFPSVSEVNITAK